MTWLICYLLGGTLIAETVDRWMTWLGLMKQEERAPVYVAITILWLPMLMAIMTTRGGRK